MKILITGGAGTLGRALQTPLREAGHTIRIMSRRLRKSAVPADIEWVQGTIGTGENLPEAVAGVDAVIHAASDPRSAEAVDVIGTRHLIEAARPAGISNLFYISIAGIDQIPFFYYQKKLEAERMIENSGIPYTILRATQFHSLINMMITASTKVPLLMPLPVNFKFRSVDESEVARRITQALARGPSGRLTDYGGPEVQTLGDMARIWQEVNGISKWIVRLPLPGTVPACFRKGMNTAPNGDRGFIGWRQWLINKEVKKSG